MSDTPTHPTQTAGVRLTKPQRAFLERCRDRTYGDNSGCGLVVEDNHEVRMAERLAARGLLHLPSVWTSFAGAKITDAGRSVLSQTEGEAP